MRYLDTKNEKGRVKSYISRACSTLSVDGVKLDKLTKFFSLTRDALFSENLAQSHSDRGADAKYVGIDWARGIRDTHVSCAVEGIDEYEACEYFYNNNYTCMMPIVIIVI